MSPEYTGKDENKNPVKIETRLNEYGWEVIVEGPTVTYIGSVPNRSHEHEEDVLRVLRDTKHFSDIKLVR